MTWLNSSTFVVLHSWRSINKGILAIAPESIARINQCSLLVSEMFKNKLFSAVSLTCQCLWRHTQLPLVWCRFVRHPWRSNGEALLPKMHGCLHPQILQTPPHRWSLFWDRVPPHAVHGAPRVSSKATSQPVCAKVCLIYFYFTFITAFLKGTMWRISGALLIKM